MGAAGFLGAGDGGFGIEPEFAGTAVASEVVWELDAELAGECTESVWALGVAGGVVGAAGSGDLFSRAREDARAGF